MKPRLLSDADCDALIAEMEAEIKGCKADLKTARRLAVDFGSVGHKSSTGVDDSPRGSEVSRPTEVQALRLIGRDHDPTRFYAATLRNRVNNLRSALADLAQTRVAIMARADPTPGRQSTIAQCVNRSCGEDIILPEGMKPDRGRCEPCRDYLEKYDRDAPSAVIKDRRYRRDKRAVTS